jgi:hypothetical protein
MPEARFGHIRYCRILRYLRALCDAEAERPVGTLRLGGGGPSAFRSRLAAEAFLDTVE